MAMKPSSLLYGENDTADSGAATEFISRLLEAVKLIHMAHLIVTGPGAYGAHKALGVYSDLDDATDGLAEAWMGCTKGKFNFPVDVSVFSAEVQNIYEYVEKNRQAMGSESHIQNEVDGICTLLSQALFKLNNFQ
jgi:hypothetical protein